MYDSKMIFIISPIVGAFVGYMTNVIAIKMLFYPKKEIRIGPIGIQGVIPAKIKQLMSRFFGVS